MKFFGWVLSFLGLFFSASAQETYFQQEVNYIINVTLNDSAHVLTGEIEMEYVNHSPDTLDYIYIHLWPNAYKNKQTAYAQQALLSGSKQFYFSEAADAGYIRDLDFKSDGVALTLETDKKNIDIGLLRLNQRLLPGKRIILKSPFKVKIPASFSRLGHVDESYQVTQWYPKPAVYDLRGWHPMPYLDQGEFYSEFGSFDVSITLPDNYVVGATGTLQTESEKQFLDDKIYQTNIALNNVIALKGDSISPSSVKMKTIRYTAQNVHDFAWFADKRFYVQKGSVTLTSGQTVETWVMFTNTDATLWKDAIQYVNRSVAYYSERVGAYPYPQATAVQSALSAGAGMEYPMITVIGRSSDARELDVVITHEVGHNWFYGILASNERDHAWMDEGLNSFYEQAYTETYYPGQGNDFLPGFLTKKLGPFTVNEMLYLLQSSRNQHQSCNTPSPDLTSINYGLCAYMQPAWNLQYLEAYLGRTLFDKAMQTYFREWKFRHPYPEDFRNVITTVSGKELDWLFDGLFDSVKKNDYALTGVRATDTNTGLDITIRNKGGIQAPVPIGLYLKDTLQKITWVEPFAKKMTFTVYETDKVVIDPLHQMVTNNRKDDQVRISGLFKKTEPLAIRLIPGLDRPGNTNLFWLPLIAYNAYDRMMAGLLIYNGIFPFKNTDYYFAPLYSFSNKSISGTGEVRRHFYSESKVMHRLTIGVQGKTFHFNELNSEVALQRFTKLMPFVELVFNKKPTALTEHSIRYSQRWIREQLPVYSDSGSYIGLQYEPSLIHEVSYRINNKNTLNPWNLKLDLEHQAYKQLNGDPGKYTRLSAEWRTKIFYNTKGNFEMRIFGGYFIQNTGRNAGNVLTSYRSRGSLGLASQGFNDYRYDEYFLGRNEDNGFVSQQVAMNEGGMKFNFGAPFANTSGFSNDFILAINLKAKLPKDLPLKLPLKPYFDAGYFHNTQPTGEDDTFAEQTMWSAGVMLDFGGVAAIYFPVVQSKNLERLYAEKAAGNYFKRITYSFNLSDFRPADVLSKLNIN